MSKVVSDIKATWNKLPPYARLGITVFGGLFAYKKAKGLFSSDPMKKTSKQISNDIAKLENDGVQATYADSAYLQFANMLFQAVAGAGTDYDAIYNIFDKIKNDVDYLKLNKAFGVRRYGAIFEKDPLPFVSNIFPLPEYTLTQALSSEMSDSKIAKLNQILKSNGVTYFIA